MANPAIRSLSGAWSQPRNTPLAGRPVAGLTFALNFAANEVDAAAYRATNIAIHIACALLLFGLVRRTLALSQLHARFGGAASNLAFAIALLWVVHPLTTDAVTYVTQRTESLMALCYLITLYASLRGHRESATHNGRSTLLWQAVAVAACAFGMGVKESMVTAPVVVALFDRVFLFDSFRAAIAVRWRLYVSLALTWLVLVFQVATTPARRLCRLWNRNQRVDLLVEPVRDDRAVSAARRVADRSRDQLRTARSVRPGRCSSARSGRGGASGADRGGLSTECGRGISWRCGFSSHSPHHRVSSRSRRKLGRSGGCTCR